MPYPINIFLYTDPDIYFDVNGLQDPFTVGIPIGITNNESVTLYFQATLENPPAGWTNYTQRLGSVGARASSIKLYSPQRSQPTLTLGELDETITLKIQAYTDADYTTLYNERTIPLTIHFFDHANPAWTVLYHDTFNDGTPQGWDATGGYVDGLSYGSLEMNSERYVSAPYSIINSSVSPAYSYKDYTVGAYSKARIVVHIYIASGYQAALMLGNKLILPKVVSSLITGKWVRICSNIPLSATTRLKWAGSSGYISWIDEIWVVAK